VKKLLGILFFIPLIVAAALAFDAYQFLHAPLAGDQKDFELEVKSGATIKSLANQLNSAGYLKRPKWWEAYARYTGEARSIKTGQFALNTSMTPIALLATLQKSQEKQYSFTILEGWNIWQLRAALAQDPVLTHTMQDVPDENVMEFIGAIRTYQYLHRMKR